MRQLKQKVENLKNEAKMGLEYDSDIFGDGAQFFGPRDSREHILSPNKCHHVFPRIPVDLKIHCGNIPITIHKHF